MFSDPAFNVVDGLDDYAEDYTQLETLAEGAAATLEHAKRTLLGCDPDAPAPTESPETATATADAEPAQDVQAPLANEERGDANAADAAVITSYSIHYTKLYEGSAGSSARSAAW